MTGHYLLGIIFAILAGVMNALGNILQKSAVNRIISRARQRSFTAQYVRDPVWLIGLVLPMGLSTIFNLASQSRIGPALVPALMASGLIVLAIGSVKLLGEKLKASEWIGIVSLVFGIALLGFSKLEISQSEVDLSDIHTQTRLAVFSILLAFFWGLSWLLAQRGKNLTRGLVMAFSSGLPYCLSNLWTLPMLMTVGLVFSGTARMALAVIFIVACIILIGTNLIGVWQTQEAYRFAPANKAIPFQQVPTQTVPILIYLFVFQRSLTNFAIAFVPLGLVLILAGAFLLAKRQVGSTPTEAGPAFSSGATRARSAPR